MRQGKRLFGLIGTGEIIAEIIAGLSVSLLVRLLGHNGTTHLLLFSTLGMAACLGILIYITRKMARRISEPEEEEEDGRITSYNVCYTKLLRAGKNSFWPDALHSCGYRRSGR